MRQKDDSDKGKAAEAKAPRIREAKAPFMERIRDRLWDVDCDTAPWWKRQCVKAARFLFLVANGFLQDECAVRASGLVYYSMISIVPVLVIALSLARAFGAKEVARDAIMRQIDQWAGQYGGTGSSPESSQAFLSLVEQGKRFLDDCFSRIDELHFGTLGGIGLAVLLWSAVEMMTHVEESLNHIWGVSGRTLWRRFADYLTVVLVVPFLALAAATLPMAQWVSAHASPSWHLRAFHFSIVLPGGGTCVAVLMLTFLFTFVVTFVPNTRVRLGPGIAGGFVTAVASTAWVYLCAALQVGVARYSKLYGGFAAVPIMPAWTYVSWEIVLLGSEVSFALQNVRTYGLEDEGRHASARARACLALEAAAAMARRFRDGVLPFDPDDYASERRISIRYMNDVVDALVRAGIAGELAGRSRRLVLMRSPSLITVRDVVSAVIDQGLPHEKAGLRELAPGIEKWAGRFAGDAGPALSATLDELAGE